jgi:hypothetical protein
VADCPWCAHTTGMTAPSAQYVSMEQSTHSVVLSASVSTLPAGQDSHDAMSEGSPTPPTITPPTSSQYFPASHSVHGVEALESPSLLPGRRRQVALCCINADTDFGATGSPVLSLLHRSCSAAAQLGRHRSASGSVEL